MIRRLPGWSANLLPAGGMMVHPEGPAVARLFYRERVAPVRRIAILASEILASWPAFVVERRGEIERMTTEDGEHAAVITVLGRDHGEVMQRMLGFVVTDDFYSTLASECAVPARFEEIAHVTRELLATDEHGLGVRRRRFEYTPPPRFQPRRRSLTTEWLAPDYPENDTTLWVHPASPRSDEALDALVARLATVPPTEAGFVVRPGTSIPTQPTRHALLGAAQAVLVDRGADQPALLRFLAVLRDEQYDYPLELLTSAHDRRSENEATFTELVSSVKPFPARGRIQRSPSSDSDYFG